VSDVAIGSQASFAVLCMTSAIEAITDLTRTSLSGRYWPTCDVDCETSARPRWNAHVKRLSSAPAGSELSSSRL